MNWNEFIANPWIQSLGIIIIAVLLAVIVRLFLSIIAKRFTAKTKTDIDDNILQIITTPLYVLMILIGLNVASQVVESVIQDIPWINGAFFVIYVILIAYVVAKILSLLVVKWMDVSKKFEKTPKLIGKIVAVIVFIIAGIVILDRLNVEITPFIATLGLGGLAIGLALQSTLSNLFAGIHILSDEPIRPGDFIEIEGTNISGFVEDIGWRSTRIKTLPNTIVVVPNSKLSESIIINDSMPQPEMAVLVNCGVSYESNLEKVEKVTVDVATQIQKTVDGAVKDFKPFIRYNKFNDSNIDFTVILRGKTFVDRYLIIHEFMKVLKKAYDKHNIEINYPARKIYKAK